MDELGDKAAARSQSALMAVTLRNASGCAGNVGVRSQSALMAVTLRNSRQVPATVQGESQSALMAATLRNSELAVTNLDPTGLNPRSWR